MIINITITSIIIVTIKLIVFLITVFSVICHGPFLRHHQVGIQVDRFVAVLFPANSARQDPGAKCTIKLDVSGGTVIRSDIKHSDDTYCGTKISEV